MPKKKNAGCECCGGESGLCDLCDGGAPLEIDVEISGVLAGSVSPCGDCTPMNATFTLHQIGTPCLWQLTLAEGVPCGFSLGLTITDLGGGMAHVEFGIAPFFAGPTSTFSADVSLPFDCSSRLELLPDSVDATMQGCDFFTGTTVVMNP